MKSLAEQMSVYSAYHRHPVNRIIHFIFVPAIVWSLMVMLDQVSLGTVAGITLTVAMLVTTLLLAWYLMLDVALGVAATAVFTMLLVSAITLNEAVPTRTALAIAGGVFVAGWVFQFIGHGVWEKRRPALMDNLFQVLVAPIFLVAEAAFSMGAKKSLHDDVQAQMKAHLPADKHATGDVGSSV